MKFVISSTELLEHLVSISRISHNNVFNADDLLFKLKSFLEQYLEIEEILLKKQLFSTIKPEYSIDELGQFIKSADTLPLRRVTLDEYEEYKEYQNISIDEIGRFIFTDNEILIIESKPIAVKISNLFNGSVKELLYRLSKYLSKRVSIQLSYLKNSLFREISIFFGLCSSSPGYIYNAIFGNNATRVLSSSVGC